MEKKEAAENEIDRKRMKVKRNSLDEKKKSESKKKTKKENESEKI